MSDYGLYVGAPSPNLGDDELDQLVREIQDHFPVCGNRQKLVARRMRVQQYRVRESQRRVDLRDQCRDDSAI